MAVLKGTLKHLGKMDGSAIQFFFETLTNGDSGAPVELAEWSDRTVSIQGTWGAGGTAVLQGSDDGTNWYTLNNPANEALSFTANAMEAILELPAKVRINVTAGDGTTDLDAYITLRRGNNMRT